MSGISAASSEAAAPKARDFAIPTAKHQNARHEKHDKHVSKPISNSRLSPERQIRPITAGGAKGSIHHPNKENLGVGRRLKETVITAFGGSKLV